MLPPSGYAGLKKASLGRDALTTYPGGLFSTTVALPSFYVPISFSSSAGLLSHAESHTPVAGPSGVIVVVGPALEVGAV